MGKIKQGKRGCIVWDQGANAKLHKIVQDSDWRIIKVSPEDKGVKRSDPYVISKYTQGRWPIMTQDATMHLNNPVDHGATGFVEHEETRLDEFENYKLKVKKFFSTHTCKDIRKKVWHIYKVGEAKVKQSI